MRPDANTNADANRSKTICRPPLKGVEIITCDPGIHLPNPGAFSRIQAQQPLNRLYDLTCISSTSGMLVRLDVSNVGLSRTMKSINTSVILTTDLVKF